MKTQNEKKVETDMDLYVQYCTYKKLLLVSVRNSAMEVGARIICNLLLKTQIMPGI